MPVLVSVQQHLPARLVAIHVPQKVADERRRKLHDTARQKGQTASALTLALANWSVFLTHDPVSVLSIVASSKPPPPSVPVPPVCSWPCEIPPPAPLPKPST